MERCLGMPKSPVSHVMRFNAPDKILGRLETAVQGTLLSPEEIESLSPEGLKEYLEYEKWVFSPKRSSR